MYLETNRLIMRNFIEADVSDAHKYLSDPETMYFIEEPFNFDDTKSFLSKYGCVSSPYVYALVTKHDEKVIGHVIFHEYDYESIYELGWIIGKAHIQNGYAFEISSKLVKYAFEELNLHKIVAETIEGNTASLHLLKKLNMREEGVYRKQNFHQGKWLDEYHYGLLKEDYVN